MKKVLAILLLLSSKTFSQTYLPIEANSTSINVSNTSLDNLTAVGFYKGSALTSAPDGGWWYITIEAHDNPGGNAAGWTKQTVTAYGAGNSYPAGTIFTRLQTGGTTWTGWMQHIQVNSSGNVGLGTNSPGNKVSFAEVNLTTEATGITWYSPAPTQYGIHRTAGDWVTPDYQQLRLGFATGIIIDPGNGYGKSYLDVKGNGIRVTEGAVGIGLTDVKGYKLAVGGAAVAEKIVVKQQANWPDFVFDSAYRLTPLNQVEAYIKENKHLPDVPSAAAVDQEGINIGDNQAALLKKIEELTLYIIQQHKEIQELKTKVEKLAVGK